MPFDFRDIFEKAGQMWVRELSQNVRDQTDINGDHFSLIRPSTALARQAALNFRDKKTAVNQGKAIRTFKGRTQREIKGAATTRTAINVPLTRLLFTGEFWQHAFLFQAEKDSLTVYCNENNYESEERTGSRSFVSFADIVRFNNQGSPELNPKISKPPLVFPNNPEQVQLMKTYRETTALIHSYVDTREFKIQFLGSALMESQTIPLKVM